MSTSRMRLRILYVAPYQPSDLAVRSRLFLEAMTARHEVDVITLRRGRTAGQDAMGERRYHAPSRVHDRLSACLRLRDGGYPLQCAASASGRVKAAVADALRMDAYDLVHVEHLRALQYLPDRIDVPVVFDAVDCVSALFDAAVPHQPPWLQPLFRNERDRITTLEEAACKRVTRVLVASHRDADAFRLLGARSPVAVVTNPVGLGRFRPGPELRRPIVVMSGKMSFHANRAAAEWLCTRIWPLVRAQCPEARLVLAGAQPPRSVRRFACADIAVRGFVPDLGALLGRAAVAVAPLPYAMGVQNKVLEAMATATPVVATPVALGGIAAAAGRQVLVGATAEAIAAQIVLLLRNPWLARTIGMAGRRFVESEHAPARIAELLNHQHLTVVAATMPAAAEANVARAG